MPGPPLVQGSCGPVRESFTETVKSILKGFEFLSLFFFTVAAFTERFVLFYFIFFLLLPTLDPPKVSDPP